MEQNSRRNRHHVALIPWNECPAPLAAHVTTVINVIFSTSVTDLEPEVGQFSKTGSRKASHFSKLVDSSAVQNKREFDSLRSGLFRTSGSEILNFRFMKTANFRFEVENRSQKITLHKFRVNSMDSRRLSKSVYGCPSNESETHKMKAH